MFSDQRRWHWFWNKQCTYKATDTYLLVLSNASFISLNPSGVSSQAFTSAESEARGRRTTGPRVIPSARIRLLAPPPSYAKYVTEAHINPENTSICPKRCPWLSPNLFPSPGLGCILKQINYIYKCQLTPIALQPLLVLATRQPSVVAIGTWNSFPSKHSGPATPTGMGIYPITFSQQAPIT